jgi:hypothetical protein
MPPRKTVSCGGTRSDWELMRSWALWGGGGEGDLDLRANSPGVFHCSARREDRGVTVSLLVPEQLERSNRSTGEAQCGMENGGSLGIYMPAREGPVHPEASLGFECFMKARSKARGASSEGMHSYDARREPLSASGGRLVMSDPRKGLEAHSDCLCRAGGEVTGARSRAFC